jgi:uncharacterized protein (DUF2147 family)
LKKNLLIFIVSIFSLPVFAESLSGFYQTLDKHTKLPTSVIAIYLYEGKYYGRIVAACNKQGMIEETTEHPKTKAPGLAGKPFYCGLDILWACAPDGRGNCKGHVFDPREGKKYNARIWKENGNLILRGEVLFFGRNETLTPFPKERFNQVFKQPNVNSFIPVRCKIK